MLGLLARARRLRGTVFDLFGRTDERRLERALIAQYTDRLDTLLPTLDRDRLALASDARFLAAREAVLRFLHERHALPAAA